MPKGKLAMPKGKLAMPKGKLAQIRQDGLMNQVDPLAQLHDTFLAHPVYFCLQQRSDVDSTQCH